MIVLDPGHRYALRLLDSENMEQHQLVFVKREGDGYPGNVGHHSGTTTQEVLRALIDRAEYVNAQVPCAETQAAADLMRSALLLLEIRAARRRGRSLDLADISTLERSALCGGCGHVGCEGECHRTDEPQGSSPAPGSGVSRG